MFERHRGYTHDLKIWGIFFNAVINGKKTFEIRKMDRDYKAGDYLMLKEWDRQFQRYTGRECLVLITYIYASDDYMQKGYGVLGIRLIGDPKVHKELSAYEQGLQYDKRVGPFVAKFRELDSQVETDKHFRKHLMQELDSFKGKLNPELKAELEKITLKLLAKGNYDL